jgi:hypothetical protein
MNEKKLVPITGSAVVGEGYVGEYIVTPSINTKILKTSKKVLSDDVTVLPIPYKEIENQAGGKTIIIG